MNYTFLTMPHFWRFGVKKSLFSHQTLELTHEVSYPTTIDHKWKLIFAIGKIGFYWRL